MLIRNLTYDTVKQRKKATGELSPKYHVPSEFMSSKINPYNERPLKSNLNDLSFKGLSFNGDNKPKKDDKMKPVLYTLGTLVATGLLLRFAPSYKKVGEYSIKEFREFAQKYTGMQKEVDGKKVKFSIGEKLLEHVKNSELSKKVVEVNDDKIIFNKKTIPQLIWDGLVYPFKILPADILNGTVTLIGKVKPFKNWATNTLNQPFFKNIRQRSKFDAQVNSLRGLFETMADLKGKSQSEISSKIFQRSIKMFDPNTGNYDTKHERSLNRLVSGLPPAIFLANDAYNLSRMMDDDKKSATQEQKVRFRQEMARIGFNAYITLITLGALNKYINNSKMGIMLMTALTTLTTEAFSRVINGKHITRLTPEEARAENLKNHAPEAEIKPEKPTFKAASNNDKNEQKPLLSFDTIMKAVLGIIFGGYAIKGARKISVIDKAFNDVSEFFVKHYTKLTVIEDYKITQKQLTQITDVLEQNGFNDLAKKYKEVAKTSTNSDGTISLGAKNKKIKPFVEFFLAPFKFIKKYVILPYTTVDDIVRAITKSKPQKAVKKITKQEALQKEILQLEALQKGDISALAKSVENIGQYAQKYSKGDISQKQFQDYVTDNILKAFNTDTMSNLSNSELSNIAKTSALAATIWFLMTDNYNMVMLKSNGNDVDGAKTKFKERFVQEGSRLFYQTLLIDLFNTTFSKQYHKSLFGMSWITLTNTTMGEWLTRKSVGVPVGIHTRNELIALEEKQENATGFERKYYDFMKRLTGKRSIHTYEVKSNPLENKPKEQTVNFTNSQVFSKTIKG